MSASLAWVSWKPAMGRPNCSRPMLYVRAASRQDLAAPSAVAEAAGDDYRGAKVIRFLTDGLSDVQSDADVQAHRRIALLVMRAHRLLHRDGATDGVDGRVEGNHEAVADGLDLAPAVRRDGVAEKPEMDAAQFFGLVVAEALHQLRRANEVRKENGDGARARFDGHGRAIIGELSAISYRLSNCRLSVVQYREAPIKGAPAG